jgi:hypothetical protein
MKRDDNMWKNSHARDKRGAAQSLSGYICQKAVICSRETNQKRVLMDIGRFSGEMSLLDKIKIHSDEKHCKHRIGTQTVRNWEAVISWVHLSLS